MPATRPTARGRGQLAPPLPQSTATVGGSGNPNNLSAGPGAPGMRPEDIEFDSRAIEGRQSNSDVETSSLRYIATSAAFNAASSPNIHRWLQLRRRAAGPTLTGCWRTLNPSQFHGITGETVDP
ncbi:hypothetical protein PCL_05667 [Purpureocillium lilacinum]|uniref:Uncharacterized protein n=1 Tax=Purpureocillium lilacinum TaxID=33203 RepID=A0A2U3DUL7_PURLI|nr:hypothetical protein PCL_05667 [Purpureocillium lilacinum]